jgi:hypothetical protein
VVLAASKESSIGGDHSSFVFFLPPKVELTGKRILRVEVLNIL